MATTPGTVKHQGASLQPLHEALEKASLSQHSDPPVSIADTVRAKELGLTLDAKGRLAHFQPGDGRLFRVVFAHAFSPSAAIRAAARRFVDAAGGVPPPDMEVEKMFGKLGAGGEFHSWMVEEIKGANRVDALKAWQTTIRILGIEIHKSSGTGLLNSLLTVVEKAFKTDDTEGRKETFRCWETLIDNFSLKENTINHSKRLKLLTRPLVANNNMNKEQLAAAKFHTWWHLICGLKDSSSKHIDSVVVPFLEFCYGHLQAPPADGSPLKPGTSPVKKFATLGSQSLETFALLFGAAGSSALRHVKPLEHSMGSVFTAKDLSHSHPIIFHALSEALGNLKTAHKADLERFDALFRIISGMVRSVESSQEKDDAATVGAFLTAVRNLVFEHKRHAHLQGTLFVMLDEVRKMPSALLCSQTAWKDGQDRPVVAMIHLMLERELFAMLRAGESEARYLGVFSNFLKKGCASRVYALNFLEAVCDKVEESAEEFVGEELEALVPLWKAVAGSLKEYVDRHQEVNQSESSLEHKLSAARKILSLPILRFMHSDATSLWKHWRDLLKQVSTAAAVIQSYTPPELENQICEEAILKGRLKGEVPADARTLTTLTTLVHSGIMPVLTFKSLKSGFPSIKGVVEVIVELIQLLPKLKDDNDVPSAALSLVDTAATFIKSVSEQSLFRPLILALFPSLATFLDADLVRQFGKSFDEAAELLVESAITVIQSRYNGAFDAELVRGVENFVVAAMEHHRRSIRTKAQQMWQLTFASSLKSADIPDRIAGLLKKSLMHSDSLSSSQDTSSSQGFSTSTTASPAPATTFGSFLNKTPTEESPLKAAKKAKESPWQTSASPKTFKKPEPSSRRSLEDEASQDFVPITNSGKKKRRVLTDHQKDRMTSRRDDIPALYSELSRDDSQAAMALPPQFDSQLNEDESSQMAMDSSAFKQLTSGSSFDDEDEDETIKDIVDKTADAASQKADDEEEETTMDVDGEGEAPVVENGSSSKRRKGRAPVKNLPPVTRRASLDSANMPSPASVKRRRGRPRKDESTGSSSSSSASPTSATDKRRRSAAATMTTGSGNDDTAKESEGVQVNPAAEVRLNRLSPNNDALVTNSPVKVIQEKPLILEASKLAAQKQQQQEKSRAVKELFSDDDVIQSSQPVETATSTETSTSGERRGRKRRRETSTLLSDKTTNSNDDSSSSSPAREAVKEPETTLPPTATPTKTKKENDKENNVELASTSSKLSTSTATTPTVTNTLKLTKNKYGETQLHVAAKKSDLTKVRALLEKGADPNVKDNAGWTPLHEAIKTDAAAVEIVELLLEHGAEVNATADDGNTPLHDAAAYSIEALIRLLLRFGADASIENKGGKTPKQITTKEMVPILEGTATTPPPPAVSSPRKLDRSPSPKKKDLRSSPVKQPKESKAVTTANSPRKEERRKSSERSSNSSKDKEEKEKEDPQQPEAGTSSEEVVSVPDSLDVSKETAAEKTAKPSPMPNFTRINDKASSSSRKQSGLVASSSFSGRGARLLEMSKKAKAAEDIASPSAATTPLMSPRVSAGSKKPSQADLMTTPTSTRSASAAKNPWEKFAPSPSTASPSVSILKKTPSAEAEDSPGPPCKRRRVQFKEPCVSDRVEIPRVNAASRVQKLGLAAKSFKDGIGASSSQSSQEGSSSSQEENSSNGLFVSTPTESTSGGDDTNLPIYPSLSDSQDPVTSILASLATPIWQKAAEKSLTENSVTKVGDLARMTPTQAASLKSLKPPNNVKTIKKALREFEKRRETAAAAAKKASPVVDVSTPEEDEETMGELFERPSPSPPLDDDVPAEEGEEEQEANTEDKKKEVGAPPPLISIGEDKDKDKKSKDKKTVSVTSNDDDGEFNVPTILSAYASQSKEEEEKKKKEQAEKKTSSSVQSPVKTRGRPRRASTLSTPTATPEASPTKTATPVKKSSSTVVAAPKPSTSSSSQQTEKASTSSAGTATDPPPKTSAKHVQTKAVASAAKGSQTASETSEEFVERAKERMALLTARELAELVEYAGSLLKEKL